MDLTLIWLKITFSDEWLMITIFFVLISFNTIVNLPVSSQSLERDLIQIKAFILACVLWIIYIKAYTSSTLTKL